MRITYKNDQMIKFECIKESEIFLYKNSFYMKLPNIYEVDYGFNCVFLHTGYLSYIDKNSIVYKVNYDLIIK